MITSNGQAIRCPVNNVRETSRGSKGVKLVDLAEKDKLKAISEVIELDEETDIDEAKKQLIINQKKLLLLNEIININFI